MLLLLQSLNYLNAAVQTFLKGSIASKGGGRIESERAQLKRRGRGSSGGAGQQ